MAPIRFNLLAASVLTLATCLAAADKKPLEVKYPDALHHGTPKPINLPNLEPSLTKGQELLVPPGTTLLSKGKRVTSSDAQPIIGELAMITDEDKSGHDGMYVELGPGEQWVQIDLQAPAKIAAIAVWHFHSQERVYHDVIVQVSDDPEFKRNVVTLYNNDHDNTAKRGKGPNRAYRESRYGWLVDAKGAVGRYVRLYSNGNTSDELNHYCEVEVFGSPAK